MRSFLPIVYDSVQLAQDLNALDRWLGDNATLKGRDEIAPFFKSRQQLAAALGLANNHVAQADLLASELDLFGDFHPDIAVGDRETGAFTLVEFEDAQPYSIFKTLAAGK